MSTPTFDLIATLTLGTSDASGSFTNLSSLSSDYRDLVIVMTHNNGGSFNATRVRINNDSGNNYNQKIGFVDQNYNANGTGPGNNSEFSFSQRFAGTSDPYCDIVQILDYAKTDKHKNGVSRSQGPRSAEYAVNRYASTNAIDSIQFEMSSGTFGANSTIYLYGIAG